MNEVIDAMALLRDDWDSYGALPPTRECREKVKKLLEAISSVLTPTRIVPSAEGGIGLCFYVEKRYGDVEFLNSGEVLACTSDGSGNPIVWEVKDIIASIKTIKDFLCQKQSGLEKQE